MRAWRRTCLATGVALASSASPAVAAPAGGAAPSARPVASSVTCASTCPALDTAGRGSVVAVAGSSLERVREVVFLGGSSASDNRKAAVSSRSASRVLAEVPAGARTGPVAVVDGYGQQSEPTQGSLTIEAGADGERAPRATGDSSLIDAQVSTSKAFFFARSKPSVSFVVQGSAPQDVRVDLVRLADERSIAQWNLADVDPGAPRRVAWNGKVGGQVQPDGRYEFRVAAGDQVLASRSSVPASASRAGSFAFYGNVFPIRGRHDYGQSAARFGAARSQRGHEGQDMPSACGTRLVAARGGVVRWKSTHAAAGNYIVVDVAGTGVDAAYMHLQGPALVDKGERIYTGQTIGYVGSTGNATACLLHFELWSAPGWYRGGSAFDPLPSLKAWDRFS